MELASKFGCNRRLFHVNLRGAAFRKDCLPASFNFSGTCPLNFVLPWPLFRPKNCCPICEVLFFSPPSVRHKVFIFLPNLRRKSQIRKKEGERGGKTLLCPRHCTVSWTCTASIHTATNQRKRTVRTPQCLPKKIPFLGCPKLRTFCAAKRALTDSERLLRTFVTHLTQGKREKNHGAK